MVSEQGEIFGNDIDSKIIISCHNIRKNKFNSRFNFANNNNNQNKIENNLNNNVWN